MHLGSYETLDAVVRRDRRRLALLLGYVRYSINPAVQAEAVQLAHHLAARLPNIVDLLLHPFSGAHGPTPALGESSTPQPWKTWKVHR